MPKYRKKPVVIEAVQFTDNNLWNDRELNKMLIEAYEEGNIFLGNDYAIIRTLEGNMKALPGDYIIKGVKGELYPCKPEIFEMTYEKVEGCEIKQKTSGIGYCSTEILKKPWEWNPQDR